MGIRRLAVSVTAAVLVVPLAAVPANAFFEEYEALDLVTQLEVDGPSWIAHRITVVDEDAVVAVGFLDADTDDEWILLATHVRGEENGSPVSLGGSLFGAGCGGLGEVHLSVEPADLNIHHRVSDTGCGGSMASLWYPSPGTYTIVNIIGSDGPLSGTLEFRVSEGVTVASATSGDAFDAADEEFGGVVNSHARAVAAEAQAIVAGSVSEHIEGELFGWFVSDGNAVLRVDGPEGSSSSIGFGFVHDGEPAGEYTFAVDAKAHAEAIFWTRVWLLGASVTLP